MGNLLDKVLGVIGVEVEEEETAEPNSNIVGEKDLTKKQKRNNLVGLPAQRPTTVMLVKARSYDEVESIAQNIKERRSVIVNLEDVDKESAQRMVDFLSGTVFALDGTVQRVSQGTFLFATCTVDVIGQILEEEDKEKALSKFISWAKK